MAETKATTKAAAKDATKPYVPTRNALTAVGDFTHGEVVYLHDSDEVTHLVDAGYLVPRDEYLENTDPVVLAEMERVSGATARESGSQPQE